MRQDERTKEEISISKTKPKKILDKVTSSFCHNLIHEKILLKFCAQKQKTSLCMKFRAILTSVHCIGHREPTLDRKKRQGN